MEEKKTQENNKRTPNPFGSLPPDSAGGSVSSGDKKPVAPIQQTAPVPPSIVPEIQTQAKSLVEPKRVLEDQLEKIILPKPLPTKRETPSIKEVLATPNVVPDSAPNTAQEVVPDSTPKVAPEVATKADANTTTDTAPESVLQNIKQELDGEGEKNRSSIRTFHSDVAETIKEQKFSVSDIALAEQKKRIRTPTKPKIQVKKKVGKNVIIIAIGAVFVLAGAFGVYLALQNLTDTGEPIDFAHETLIFVNEQLEVPATNLSRRKTLELLSEVKGATNLSLGEIADIQFITSSLDTSRVVNSSYFLNLLDSRASSAFDRALLNEFMLGIHMFDEERYFIILKTDSFETAFAEIFKWEDKIEDDLSFIVRKVKDITPPTQVATSTATSTPTATNTPEKTLAEIHKNKFIDVVIRNRDVRAIFGSDGKPTFLYSFPDKETIVITSNANTLVEVFERLTTARFR